MQTIEIKGEEYTVDYNNWSFLALKDQFGFDVAQSNMAAIANQQNPSFTELTQFVALGLVNNHAKVEIERLMRMTNVADLMQHLESFSQEFMKCFEGVDEIEETAVGKEEGADKGK